MKKNTLLALASVVGTVFSIMLIVALLAFTGFFIFYQIKPSAFEGVMVRADNQEIFYEKTVSREVQSTTGPGTNKIKRTIKVGKGVEKGVAVVPLEKVHLATLVYLYLQQIISLGLLYLITREVLKVINSVQVLDTFRTGNVQSFRRIGFMCLGLSLVQWVTFFMAEGHSTFGFSIEVTPLVFMLAAFILAEIFKEGNQLYEQEQLTI